MKLCVDCEHHVALCVVPHACKIFSDVSPVDGSNSVVSCFDARDIGGVIKTTDGRVLTPCGPKAMLWKAKCAN